MEAGDFLPPFDQLRQPLSFGKLESRLRHRRHSASRFSPSLPLRILRCITLTGRRRRRRRMQSLTEKIARGTRYGSAPPTPSYELQSTIVTAASNCGVVFCPKRTSTDFGRPQCPAQPTLIQHCEMERTDSNQRGMLFSVGPLRELFHRLQRRRRRRW